MLRKKSALCRTCRARPNYRREKKSTTNLYFFAPQMCAAMAGYFRQKKKTLRPNNSVGDERFRRTACAAKYSNFVKKTKPTRINPRRKFARRAKARFAQAAFRTDVDIARMRYPICKFRNKKPQKQTIQNCAETGSAMRRSQKSGRNANFKRSQTGKRF